MEKDPAGKPKKKKKVKFYTPQNYVNFSLKTPRPPYLKLDRDLTFCRETGSIQYAWDPVEEETS